MLRVDPCVPKAWPGFDVTIRYRMPRYLVVIENAHGRSRGIASISLDGVRGPVSPARVPLVDDGASHRVRAVLGEPTA